MLPSQSLRSFLLVQSRRVVAASLFAVQRNYSANSEGAFLDVGINLSNRRFQDTSSICFSEDKIWCGTHETIENSEYPDFSGFPIDLTVIRVWDVAVPAVVGRRKVEVYVCRVGTHFVASLSCKCCAVVDMGVSHQRTERTLTLHYAFILSTYGMGWTCLDGDYYAISWCGYSYWQ